MIRVYVTIDSKEQNGGSVLFVTGHANTKVCAAASAVFQGAALALQAIAKANPDECSYTELLESR